jgi:hypothetical protein
MPPGHSTFHDLNLACACGATLKMSVTEGNTHQLDPIVQAWNASHADTGGWGDGDHEPVSLHEAGRVRTAVRNRKRRERVARVMREVERQEREERLTRVGR